MSDSEADAIALFRPKDRAKLEPFLDLDDESDESEGLYAELLDDGSVLVHTFQPYAAFEESVEARLEWLSQFGSALPDVHDDPRGLLIFPDSLEPSGASYEAVVEEVEEHGMWIALQPSSFEIGRLLTNVQEQLFDALGATGLLDEVPPEEPE
jgi:hypothetical protein